MRVGAFLGVSPRELKLAARYVWTLTALPPPLDDFLQRVAD